MVQAFDKADLDLLVLKLKRYGFGDQLVDWIQAFLSDREQVVVLNGVHSDRGPFWGRSSSFCS